MKKKLTLAIIFMLGIVNTFAQNHLFISQKESPNVIKNKIVERQSFPSEFSLVKLDTENLRLILVNAPQRFSGNEGVLINLPNADGLVENYKVTEFSNFDPILQKANPDIKSFFGINTSDKSVLRMSMSPNGFQFINFKESGAEYMEPFSSDLKLYAIYKTSQSTKELPVTCTTSDIEIAQNLLNDSNVTSRSSTPELLTFRLALSCTGEYGNYFGGTFNSVLSQMNVTMTNVNAIFERDLNIKMNIISSNNLVMYYNASTDPYSPGATGSQGAWNDELQATLNAQLDLTAYDIGHLFGSTGGGGNAGCIGCVCLPNKGRGFTSPNSGPASGPGFDIDYVSHEMGHQYGGRHTFSHGGIGGTEYGTATIEVGSGSTIMSYAGITNYDIVSNAGPYFSGFTIKQIEDNMVSKTCPIRTPKNNIAPTVYAGIDYTIPASTPFLLTGTAFDANGDPLTYCWEQNDPGTVDEGLALSTAGPFKTTGPNFRSYLPTSSNLRYFPILSRTIANQKNSLGIDANMLSESLSTSSRTLNFMLTVRDNSINGGLTKRDDMVVNVTDLAGPFEVTIPNTALTWDVATNQTVTWNVAGTTVNGINAKYVDIYLSTNGGSTYPILLASKVPNDGSEIIIVPNNIGTANRIMIKGFDHIFFDISNTNFAITAPAVTFAIKTPSTVGSQTKAACQGSSLDYALQYETYGGFAGSTAFSVTGLPAGVLANFTPSTLTASSSLIVTISNTGGVTDGLYGFTVNAVSSGTTKTQQLYMEVVNATFGVQNLTTPLNNAVGQIVATPLSWAATSGATQYSVQIATDFAFTNIVASSTLTGTTFTASLNEGTDYFWRVLPQNLGCFGTYSSVQKFSTGQTLCTQFSNNNAILISAIGTPTITSSINVPSGVNITDVNVSVNITHSNVNQLTGILTSPQGAIVYLFANPCTATSQNIVTTFDDEATTDFNCLSGTTFRPIAPLDACDNSNSTGNWTFEIQDSTAGNGGSLNNWSLNICGFQSLSIGTNQLAGFSLFPNPTDGIFTIKFEGDDNYPVLIEIYDVQGRLVNKKSFVNGSNFSQEISIESTEQGVYFVKIQNGEQSTVKRIIKK